MDPLDRLDGLVRRLRGFTSRGWQVHNRAGAVRRLADDLAAIGAAGHRLPELPDYALPDVIAVVGADAVAADGAAATALIDAALDATR